MNSSETLLLCIVCSQTLILKCVQKAMTWSKRTAELCMLILEIICSGINIVILFLPPAWQFSSPKISFVKKIVITGDDISTSLLIISTAIHSKVTIITGLDVLAFCGVLGIQS